MRSQPSPPHSIEVEDKYKGTELRLEDVGHLRKEEIATGMVSGNATPSGSETIPNPDPIDPLAEVRGCALLHSSLNVDSLAIHRFHVAIQSRQPPMMSRGQRNMILASDVVQVKVRRPPLLRNIHHHSEIWHQGARLPFCPEHASSMLWRQHGRYVLFQSLGPLVYPSFWSVAQR